LRRRVPLAVTLLVAMAVALSLLSSFLLLRREFTNRAKHQLAQQMVGAATYYASKQQDLEGAVLLIQSDNAVSTALQHGDRTALIVLLQRYSADFNVDRLDIVDALGRVVVSEGPLAIGDSLAALPSVHAALHGGESCGVEQDPSDPGKVNVLRVTVPLYSATGALLGAVSIGRTLDSIFATEIGNAVQATIHLQATGASGATASRSAPPCVFTPPSAQAASASITNRQEDGRAVLSGVVRVLGTDGRVGGGIEVIQPLSDVYDVITSVTTILLLVGLVVAAISAGVGIALSGGLIRRLSALEQTAAAVAGGDLEQQMPVQGEDEIASLARSLGRMVQSLRERMTMTTRLRDTAEARVHELEGLAEIAQLLTSAPSLATTLDEVATRVCAIVGCAAAAVVLLEEDPLARERRHVVLRGAHGMQPPTRELLSQIIAATQTPYLDATSGADTPSEEPGAAGTYPFAFRRAVRENTTQWLSLATLLGTAASDEAKLLYQAGLQEGWGAATAVPMVLQEQSRGVVICFTAEPAPLPEAELRVLRTVVGQATIAIENARLFAQSHELAVLEERTRLARDLHDSVTQSLFSLNLAARAATNARTRQDPARLDRALAMVGDLAQSTLSEMRALLFELRPAQLQGEGLLVALRNHAVAMEQRTGLAIQVDLPDTCTLPPAHEDALYRVAQEALTNVARHAQARHALVRLRRLDEWVELTIEDDGVGMVAATTLAADPASAAGRYGLRGMRERVEGLGGQVTVHSASSSGIGGGTVLSARLPVPVPEASPVAPPGLAGTGAACDEDTAPAS
jgi:signal transduction histidine kinase